MRAKTWILKIGETLGRPEGELPEGSAWLLTWKKRIGVSALALLIVGFTGFIFMQAREWRSAKLEVSVPWSEWHTLYGETEENLDHNLNRPSTKHILESPATKADPDSTELVQKNGQKPYWVASTIPVASLKAAALARAQVLSLGYSSSAYRLWIDDSLVLEGSEKISQLVSVPISRERLLTEKPLTIVFENKNVSGWIYPDMLELFLKSPGFMTGESAAIHAKEMDFFTTTKPSLLFAVYLMMAMGFLFFWISSPKRQEYFVMFVYALLLSVLQGHLLKFGQNLMTPIMGYRFDVFAYCLESGLILTIALAFARVRKSLMRGSLILFSLTPLLLIWAYPDRRELLLLSAQIQKYLAPPLLSFGALICFVQAVYLLVGVKMNLKTKHRRVLRLMLFGLGLVMVAFMHRVEADLNAFEGFRFWSIAHLGVVVFLASFVLSDYHETEALIGRVPFSAFHRPENLNQAVTGSVISMDLKNSEVLLRAGASRGDSSELIQAVVMLVRHTLTALGGTLILTDGDAVKCFFPENPRARFRSLEVSVNALSEVQAELNTLVQTLRSQDRLSENYEISFRAGIAEGSIRPIFVSFNGKDHPEWEQVGESQVFLESARLMEAENTLGRIHESRILIFKSIPSLQNDWSESHIEVKFKHGQVTSVVSLVPTPRLRATG